ncbi:cytochrome-b5 reductase [Amylocystis lapponica]|nr:cytochrome-b5 reductase [Amylocystis lapponica]
MHVATRQSPRLPNPPTCPSGSAVQARPSPVLFPSPVHPPPGIAGLAGYIYLKPSSAPKAQAAPQKSPLDPKNYVDFALKRIEDYNYNTAKYVFELPNNATSQLPVASCVLVQPASDASDPIKDSKGELIHRPYTPVSPPDLPGEFVFLIKRYEGGKMSQYIHSLKPGEKIGIKGPLMKIPIKINEFDEVGMIAGGSGITPMYQVLKYALADPANKTRYTLVFANVAPRDILLRDEFDALAKAHPATFKLVHTLDQPPPDWAGAKGYVNKELIMQHIPPPSLGTKVKVLICGPPGQVAAVAGKKDGMQQGEVGGVLKELGYTKDQVFKF